MNIELMKDGNYRYYDKKGNSFVFSPEDYELVTAHRWRVFRNWYGSEYAMRINSEGRLRVLSREILGVNDSNLFVDHINGNTLDYTRANLRTATPSNNSWNAGLNAKNTSGYKGVSWNKRQKVYTAYITVNRQLKYLGNFNNAIDAARAYDTAARYYFGEFACVNFPMLGEQGCRRNRTV